LEFGFLGDLTPLGFIAGLLLAIVIGLVIVFVLPLLLLVAEIALALAAVLLFRGTWIVDATTVGPPAERKAWRSAARVVASMRSKKSLPSCVPASKLRQPRASQWGQTPFQKRDDFSTGPRSHAVSEFRIAPTDSNL
jgi:hypothetical protein